MFPSLRRLTLAVATASLAVPALAQDSSTRPVEEIVVISSRVPIPLRQIGTSVSVITEADIEAHGNISITDVLRQMPAMATSNSGGAGKATSLRIRGEEGFRTLTIFDGMRLTDPSGPQVGPQLEHLMSSGIGRVEVLRGPQGLSYGADAGGVVNISSRQSGTGLSGSVDAQGGRYGTQQYSGNLSGGNQTVDFFLAASDFQTDGFNTSTDDKVNPDNDGYDNTTFHGRVGVNLNDQWRVDLVHRQVDGFSQYDGCYLNGVGTIHDCAADYALKASRVGLQYESETYTHSFSYATTDTDRDSLSAGVSAFASQGELERLEYVGSLQNLPGFNLVFGADLESIGFNANDRDNVGYYLEYLSDFSESLFLTAGVRYDDNDDFGTNTSYRFSGAYLFDLANDATLKLRSSYGTGFRAPSPYEINYNQTQAMPPALGLALSQEESSGIEVGVEYFTDAGLRLEAVFFNQDVKDAIEFDMVSYSGYLQYGGTSTSRGVEFNGEFSLSPTVDLRANYTYNKTEQPDGNPRRRRPEHLVNLGLSWTGLDDRLSANAYYRISRDSVDLAPTGNYVKLDDFEVLDLSLNYAVTDNLAIYTRLENVLDERYQEVATYNSAGAAAYIGVKFSFAQ